MHNIRNYVICDNCSHTAPVNRADGFMPWNLNMNLPKTPGTHTHTHTHTQSHKYRITQIHNVSKRTAISCRCLPHVRLLVHTQKILNRRFKQSQIHKIVAAKIHQLVQMSVQCRVSLHKYRKKLNDLTCALTCWLTSGLTDAKPPFENCQHHGKGASASRADVYLIHSTILSRAHTIRTPHHTHT